jgi:Holliday junction DNA helicase RuvA
MIGVLRGEVVVRGSDHVVLLCGGVGYRTGISSQTLRHVPGIGSEAMLHTHLIVRDDALALYGFHCEDERDLFLMLLAVQAVGPKVALAVLSAGPPRELLDAIAAGDEGRFQAVSGIGKRTAQRIIVELREKVGLAQETVASSVEILASRTKPTPRALARDGLLELGFTPSEAQALLSGVEGESAEELIQAALRGAHAG